MGRAPSARASHLLVRLRLGLDLECVRAVTVRWRGSGSARSVLVLGEGRGARRGWRGRAGAPRAPRPAGAPSRRQRVPQRGVAAGTARGRGEVLSLPLSLRRRRHRVFTRPPG